MVAALRQGAHRIQYDTIQSVSSEDRREWLKMENVMFGMTHPSFIDLKMGRQTYSQDYPEAKRKRHMEADMHTTTPTHGFKVSGMVLRDQEGKPVKKLYKESIPADQLASTFRALLMSNGASKPNAAALEYFVNECKELLEYFKNVTKRYFIAASLFLVISNIDNKYTLKLIDFAHVKPVVEIGQAHDEGFIFGLENVIKTLIEAGK